MKNRSTTEMAAAVLATAFKPINKTQIMFRSGVHRRQLDPILERLQDKELMEYDVKSRTFLITERGRDFLDLYSSMVQDVTFGNVQMC